MRLFSELRDGIALKKQIHTLEEQNRILHASLQASFDLLTTTGDDATNKHYTGNPYNSYSTKVHQLRSKYDGLSDWGCGITRTIVDMRSAFILGGGVIPFVRAGVEERIGSRELDYIKRFLAFNSLDLSTSSHWVRHGEIEGKVLIRLQRSDSDIRAIHVPWVYQAYTVTPDEEQLDFMHYREVTFDGAATGELSTEQYTARTARLSGALTEPFFVYVRFGGIGSNVNTPVSKPAHALRLMEDLDKNAWDWRKWNRLFASPTPDFQMETAQDAQNLWNFIKSGNWRIGKAIVHTGKFEMVQAPGDGYATMKAEAESIARQLSGITGVPPQLFGFSDLNANIATGSSLMEGLVLSTNDERREWESGFRELFRKVLEQANRTQSMAFDTGVISARIPSVSTSKLQELSTVWLPLFSANAIDLHTLLSHIPEIDVEAVAAAVKAEEDERHAKEMESLRENRGANPSGPSGIDNRISGPVADAQRSDRRARREEPR